MSVLKEPGYQVYCNNDPFSYKGSSLRSDSNEWMEAMAFEIKSLHDNQTWYLWDVNRFVKKGYSQKTKKTLNVKVKNIDVYIKWRNRTRNLYTATERRKIKKIWYVNGKETYTV